MESHKPFSPSPKEETPPTDSEFPYFPIKIGGDSERSPDPVITRELKGNLQKGSEDKRDRDEINTDEINEAISRAVVKAGEAMTECGRQCCKGCGACLGVFVGSVKEIANKTWRVTKESYPLFIRPLCDGVGEFFRDSNGEYRVYQPVKDAAMMPLNAAIVLADGVLPLDTKGGLGWPGVPILARLIECFQLLMGACRGSKKEPVAAITGATLAVYLGTSMIGVMNSFMNWCSSGDAPTIGDLFNPCQILENLMKSNPEPYQKFILVVGAYIFATMGYVGGKEFMLHGFDKLRNQLNMDLGRDGLKRAIDSVLELNDGQISPEELQACLDEVGRYKDWRSAVDMVGRGSALIWKIPAAILKFSSVARYTTLPKSLLHAEERVKDAANKSNNSCIKKFADCAWKQPKESKVISYQEMLEKTMAEYNFIATAPHTAGTLFDKNNKNSGKQERLNAATQEYYIRQMASFQLARSGEAWVPSLPALPSGVLPPPGNPWANDGAEERLIAIKKMLIGDFSDVAGDGNLDNLLERAKIYQEKVYECYFPPMYPDLDKSPELRA